MTRIPVFDDVRAAAKRIAGHARRTPLLADTPLDRLTGGRILLKLETLQHTGSFKFRGAWNRLARLDESERAAGVVAFSSGNHAQGVAEAARRLGIRATIVMPSDAPRMKLQNTLDMGAEVVEYDRVHESREQIAAKIAAERGATLVPSFDDPDVIAGQGTVGLEIAEQAADLRLTLDDVIVCCSGGGLTAGIAIAIQKLAPHAAIWTAEPEAHDDHRRSLETGRRQRNEPGMPASICDALLAPMPGELTFAINQPLLRGGLAVSDDEVRRAIAFAARTLKLVVEPGGAVALACVMSGKLDTRDRTVAVTLSGGNIDDALLAAILAAP
ncbi:MAG TPA: threonine/serine dehydratase [Steroidobacteraceae bacterium]|nr:threonine/serine dehydratase [Steroidobacteraceae bacterium]